MMERILELNSPPGRKRKVLEEVSVSASTTTSAMASAKKTRTEAQSSS